MDVIKDRYIPIFTNGPGDYREYRARVMLYKQKMELQKRPKEATINLLTSLTDIAWRQVEHLATSAPEAADGFDHVLRVLDKTFKYDDRVEMPKAMDGFFYQLGRRNEQTLMSYTADYREAYRDLQNCKISLPDEVRAWILLKRSGLSADQRQMVMTQVGINMMEASVEEAFYLLYGQDYRGRANFGSSSPNRGKGKGAKSWYPSRNQACYSTKNEGIYAADDDAAYYENVEPFDLEDDDFHDYDEDFDGVEPETPCTSRKGNSKSGKGYGGKNRQSNGPSPQKGDAKSRGKPALGSTSAVCFKCNQPGHLAANCPKNTSSPNTSTKHPRSSHSINMVREQQHTNNTQQPHQPNGYFATQDGGASSMVAGHNVVMNYVDYLIQNRIKVESFQFRLCDKTFHFGGDRELHSEWSVHLPVWIANKYLYGCLKFIVEGNTPMLLGRPILKALKVKVN